MSFFRYSPLYFFDLNMYFQNALTALNIAPTGNKIGDVIMEVQEKTAKKPVNYVEAVSATLHILL